MVTKIMPIGASNTNGMYQDPTSPGGYRGPLQYMLQAQGLSFDFVGLDHDGAIADPDHNGHSGKTIDWYIGPVNETIYDPHTLAVSHVVNSGGRPAMHYFLDQAGMTGDDIVLLLIGTNNLGSDSVSTMLEKARQLLDLTVSYASPLDGHSPLVHVMELQPIGTDPSSLGNQKIAAYNSGLGNLIASRYADLAVTLVDNRVTIDELADGVHMTEGGYRSTAAAWYESLISAGHVDLLALSERPRLSHSNAEASDSPTRELMAGGGSQSLVGSNARDLLDGGAGRDTMRGKRGDDTYVVDSRGDAVLERGREGVDSVKTTLGEYTAPRQVENVSCPDDRRNVLFGNGLDNVLRAGAGKDRIDGGSGGDVLIGGAGADVFVLRQGEAQDDRVHFQGGDQLRLAGFGPGAVLVENHTPRNGPDGFYDPRGDWCISYDGRVEVLQVVGSAVLTEGIHYIFV